MNTYKPNRSDNWTDFEEYDFDDNSSDYNEFDNSALEALTVHLGSENYFDGYAE